MSKRKIKFVHFASPTTWGPSATTHHHEQRDFSKPDGPQCVADYALRIMSITTPGAEEPMEIPFEACKSWKAGEWIKAEQVKGVYPDAKAEVRRG